MQLSIIPEIILERKIIFSNELDLPIELCVKSNSNYIKQFQTPFIIIDNFAKKTVQKEEIVNIEIEELVRLDYVVIARKTNRGWFKGQKTIYLLEKKTLRTPGARRISYIPKDHKIQKDIPNKKIRLCGPNAGVNGFGPWHDLK